MLLFWTIILASTLVAFAIVVAASRILRLRATARFDPAQTDFAMDELHALLRQGKLTPEEFERARASVLSRRTEPPDDQPPRAKGFEILEPRDHI